MSAYARALTDRNIGALAYRGGVHSLGTAVTRELSPGVTGAAASPHAADEVVDNGFRRRPQRFTRRRRWPGRFRPRLPAASRDHGGVNGLAHLNAGGNMVSIDVLIHLLCFLSNTFFVL